MRTLPPLAPDDDALQDTLWVQSDEGKYLLTVYRQHASQPSEHDLKPLFIQYSQNISMMANLITFLLHSIDIEFLYTIPESWASDTHSCQRLIAIKLENNAEIIAELPGWFAEYKNASHCHELNFYYLTREKVSKPVSRSLQHPLSQQELLKIAQLIESVLENFSHDIPLVGSALYCLRCIFQVEVDKGMVRIARKLIADSKNEALTSQLGKIIAREQLAFASRSTPYPEDSSNSPVVPTAMGKLDYQLTTDDFSLIEDSISTDDRKTWFFHRTRSKPIDFTTFNDAQQPTHLQIFFLRVDNESYPRLCLLYIDEQSRFHITVLDPACKMYVADHLPDDDKFTQQCQLLNLLILRFPGCITHYRYLNLSRSEKDHAFFTVKSLVDLLKFRLGTQIGSLEVFIDEFVRHCQSDTNSHAVVTHSTALMYPEKLDQNIIPVRNLVYDCMPYTAHELSIRIVSQGLATRESFDHLVETLRPSPEPELQATDLIETLRLSGSTELNDAFRLRVVHSDFLEKFLRQYRFSIPIDLHQKLILAALYSKVLVRHMIRQFKGHYNSEASAPVAFDAISFDERMRSFGLLDIFSLLALHQQIAIRNAFDVIFSGSLEQVNDRISRVKTSVEILRLCDKSGFVDIVKLAEDLDEVLIEKFKSTHLLRTEVLFPKFLIMRLEKEIFKFLSPADDATAPLLSKVFNGEQCHSVKAFYCHLLSILAAKEEDVENLLQRFSCLFDDVFDSPEKSPFSNLTNRIKFSVHVDRLIQLLNSLSVTLRVDFIETFPAMKKSIEHLRSELEKFSYDALMAVTLNSYMKCENDGYKELCKRELLGFSHFLLRYLVTGDLIGTRISVFIREFIIFAFRITSFPLHDGERQPVQRVFNYTLCRRIDSLLKSSLAGELSENLYSDDEPQLVRHTLPDDLPDVDSLLLNQNLVGQAINCWYTKISYLRQAWYQLNSEPSEILGLIASVNTGSPPELSEQVKTLIAHSYANSDVLELVTILMSYLGLAVDFNTELSIRPIEAMITAYLTRDFAAATKLTDAQVSALQSTSSPPRKLRLFTQIPDQVTQLSTLLTKIRQFRHIGLHKDVPLNAIEVAMISKLLKGDFPSEIEGLIQAIRDYIASQCEAHRLSFCSTEPFPDDWNEDEGYSPLPRLSDP